MSKIVVSGAHCTKTKRPFSVQFRNLDGCLLAAGAFVSVTGISNTNNDDALNNVQMAIGDEYTARGCPLCGNKGLYNCGNCGTLLCCTDADDQFVTCPVCGYESHLVGSTSQGSIDPNDSQG